MSFEESQRIHNIACTSYPTGKHLAAAFKTYDGRIREINYFTPKDIPLSLYLDELSLEKTSENMLKMKMFT